MKRLSEKVYLRLDAPTDDAPISDHQRLQAALLALGYESVHIPLHMLQKLYPICRQEAGITVTMVFREDDTVAAQIEPGDTTAQHYGLAVDYGSTTIHVQLIDLHSGAAIGLQKAENGQIEYGTDILTRITYSMETPRHIEELRLATVTTFSTLLSQLTEETGIDATSLPVMVLSGNTTMIHFLLGLNAWTVFAAPFAPVTTDPGWFWGKE